MPSSPPFLFSYFQRKPTTGRPDTYHSGTLKMFIYRSSGSLGRGLKDGCLLLFKPRDSLPWHGVGGRVPLITFDGCRQPLAGLQRAAWRLQMCDCSQGPNLFRGGDPIRIFFIQPHRHRAFSKGPAVIQCISEIKASPHSCLMLTASWKNWLGVDLGGSLPSLLLYPLYRSLSLRCLTLLFNP